MTILSSAGADRTSCPVGTTVTLPEFTRHEVRVLAMVARGADARGLAREGLYRSEAAAVQGVEELGCALARGEVVRWSRIVHLAVLQGAVPAPYLPAVDLPAFQHDLLYAYAAGYGLAEYAHMSRGAVSLGEARELRLLLCHRLGATGSANAVYLGHQRRLLAPGEVVRVAFEKGARR